MQKQIFTALMLVLLLSDSAYAMNDGRKNQPRRKGGWQKKQITVTPEKSPSPFHEQTIEHPLATPAQETHLHESCSPPLDIPQEKEQSDQMEASLNSLDMEHALPLTIQRAPAVETETTELVYTEPENALPSEPIVELATAAISESETKLPANGPEETVCAAPAEVVTETQPTAQPEKAKKGTPSERPISTLTKTFHWRSDHMTFALALLLGHEGTKKEVGHQVDRAIEYTKEQIDQIANSKADDSIESIEEIIKQQKPFIKNLRELIELTQQNEVQALEKSLSLAWRTIQKHNNLCIKRALLVCKEDTDTLKKNKAIGKTIQSLKYEKDELDGEISDEEYHDLGGLFDKIGKEAYE